MRFLFNFNLLWFSRNTEPGMSKTRLLVKKPQMTISLVLLNLKNSIFS